MFVYNNKTNKLQKFENILSRRILYKYIYSMYINYSKKIKETLNRPRFFYLNIIEPKTFNYYSNIVKLYENILITSNKGKIFYLCLLMLKLNFIFKKYNLFLKKSWLYDKNRNNIEDSSMFTEETDRNVDIINNNLIDKIMFKRRVFNKKKRFSNNYYYNLHKKYINLERKKLKIWICII